MDWTGNGAVVISAIGSLLVVLGTILSAIGQNEQAKQNSRLANKTLTSVVGSPDGYLVVFANFGDGVPAVAGKDATTFFVNNTSDYPMIGTSIMIFNWSGSKKSPENTGLVYSRFIGDVFEHHSGPVLNYIAPLRRDVDNFFDIVINSRAVWLQEKIVITWDGSKFVSDYSLVRSGNGRTIDSKTIKFIRDDFPFTNPPKNLSRDEWKLAKLPE